MGEETDNPGRNIPRALAGTLLLTGVLFVVVMFAQVNGFGTDQAGLDAFQSSGNTLGDLGGRTSASGSLLIIFTAIVSAFGCHLATSATSGRMLYAFARDGCPTPWHITQKTTGGPRRRHLVQLVMVPGGGPNLRSVEWPTWVPGTTRSTPTSCSPSPARRPMVCYLLVEIAAAWFGRLTQVPARARRQGQGPRPGATDAWRVGDRRGPVVQRQGRRNMVRRPLLGLTGAIGLIAVAASGIAKAWVNHFRRAGVLAWWRREHALRAQTKPRPGIEKLRFFPLEVVRARLTLGPPDGGTCSTCRPRGRHAVLGTATPRSSKPSAGPCEAHPACAGCRRCIPIRWVGRDLLALVPELGERRVYLGHAGSDANDSPCEPAGMRQEAASWSPSSTATTAASESRWGSRACTSMRALPDPDVVFPLPQAFSAPLADVDAEVAHC